ncbi:MAG: PAS domain-containing protein [Desulfobacterales bacterium]|nr:PAS domain-containing protein [Desulfobacterales bacterium]
MSDAKILVVEDEGIEALDLQHRLTSLGYTVLDAASTGEEAVGMAEDTCPDLVLMDIMLSGEIDGVTAAEQIRTRLDIPIIYLTAYADEATLQRAKITEPYGYIVKPFRERELHITIDMALYKHKMERRLKESEKWLATTLRSIGDAVIATDRNGLITFMNAVAEDLMGWKLEEVLKRKLSEVFKIVNRNTRNPVENPVERVLLEGMVVGLANHTVLIARNGKEVPIDDSAAPIKDDKGNLIGVVLVFRDITEREKAEETLRYAKEEWERTFNTVPDLIAILDNQHRIVRANRAMAARLGVMPDQCVGLRCYEAVHGMQETPGFCPHSLTCRDGQEHVSEVHEPRLGGHFLVSTTPLCEAQGRIIGSVHVARDITDRKRSEEALETAHAQLQEHARKLEEKNRELEGFAYTVSHDLRAPLRAINGFARMLTDDYGPSLEEEVRRRLSVIETNAIRMGLLIDDLLAFSRSGRTAMNVTGIDMNRLVADVLETLKPSEGTMAGIYVAALPSVRGDPALIRQVLANLLGNAMKFSRNRNDPSIHVGSFEQDSEQVYFVKDNGIGFDMKYSDKLFGVFQRLVTDREFEGTGVGLAIVHRLVSRHGGRIWAESRPGEGATFFFTLNCKKRRNSCNTGPGQVFDADIS